MYMGKKEKTKWQEVSSIGCLSGKQCMEGTPDTQKPRCWDLSLNSKCFLTL